jgi:hypothetical protein
VFTKLIVPHAVLIGHALRPVRMKGFAPFLFGD